MSNVHPAQVFNHDDVLKAPWLPSCWMQVPMKDAVAPMAMLESREPRQVVDTHMFTNAHQNATNNTSALAHSS